MKRAAVILAAGSVFCLASQTGQASAQAFDGRWNVVLTTSVGQCEPSLPSVFLVKGHDILADTRGELRADGQVERNGDMWMRLSRGNDQYRAQGRFRGGSGEGAWSSGSRYCGGRWRATRVR